MLLVLIPNLTHSDNFIQDTSWKLAQRILFSCYDLAYVPHEKNMGFALRTDFSLIPNKNCWLVKTTHADSKLDLQGLRRS